MSCKGHEWKNSPEAQASLDAAEEEGGCQLAPEETPALSTQGSLAEFHLVQDRYSHLEWEVTALQEEAKQLCRQNTQIYTMEIFYSEGQGFLEASATRETSLPLEGEMFPAGQRRGTGAERPSPRVSGNRSS